MLRPKFLRNEIYCFEPNPDTYRDLQNNIHINGLAINTFNLALSNKKERCRLFIPDGACGGTSIDAKNYFRRDLLPGEQKPTRFHEVEAEVFDDLWPVISAKAAPPLQDIVVKLDAEGYELTIVSGMSGFINTYADRITFLVELYDSEYDDALAVFGGHGFTCSSILPDGSAGKALRPGKNHFGNYCFKMNTQDQAVINSGNSRR